MPYRIIIDSANQIAAQSVSNSDFKVKLETNFTVKKSRFKQLLIPFSWYPIDSTNNTLVFKEGGGNLTATILTPTTWGGSDIAVAVQTAMNLVGGQTYTVSFNDATSKFTISAPTTNFTLLFATTATTINKILGFSLSDSAYTGAKTYTSTNVSYCLGPPYVVIKSKALTSQAKDKSRSFYGSTTSGNSVDTVIPGTTSVYMVVPVVRSFGGVIPLLEGETGTREIDYSGGTGRSDQVLSIIDLQLVNPWTDAVININGANWMLEIECDSIDN